MPAVPSDEEPNGAPRQPPYVLSAWIADQIADLRKAQVRRLIDLCARLQSEAFEWDDGPLAQSVSAWNAAGRDLRFLDLRHNVVARMMGRHKGAYARFVAACERVRDCVSAVKRNAAALEACSQKDRGSNAKRALLELDMEWKALVGDVDQGVTWLQDLCTQLGEARAQGNDDPRLDTFAESAQRYTQDFKRLQSAGAMARDTAIRAQSVLQRRAALLEQVRADLDGFDKTWSPRLETLANDAKALRRSFPGIPKAIEAHDEMMKRLAAMADASSALQSEEQLLAQQLAMLRGELEAPRY